MEPIYVTQSEFELSVKRIDDENKRQNERLKNLENGYQVVNQLSIHMERLAINMETMAKELARQGGKLNELEMKPVKHWDSVVTTIITGIAGALVGAMLKGWII